MLFINIVWQKDFFLRNRCVYKKYLEVSVMVIVVEMKSVTQVQILLCLPLLFSDSWVRRDRFLPFPRTLAQSEIQTTLSRI